jgi:hypothetical protein
MCRGCLPTRIRLHDKGVQCPTQCVSCVSPHEDMAQGLEDVTETIVVVVDRARVMIMDWKIAIA